VTAKWYVLRDGVTQYGPYDEEQLHALAEEGRVVVTDLLWKEGTADWVPASSLADLFAFHPVPNSPPPPPHLNAIADYGTTKIVAGIMGIVLGSLGIHKFIIGATKPGLIMLAVTVLSLGCCALPMMAVGIAEGIIYLTMSDEDFYRKYFVEKKEWF
jgi:TM2 domain-containing membrane protein YozV